MNYNLSRFNASHQKGGSAVNETVQRTMLFDFYGELLTEKQREYFDLHYNEDLSLAEIASMTGISRQGVWDNIRRAEATLFEIEEKTGLVKRFSEQREKFSEIQSEAEKLSSLTTGPAHELSERVLRLLSDLEG